MKNNEPVIYTPGTSEKWVFDLGENGLIELSGGLIPRMTQEESAGYISPDGFRTCSLLDFFNLGGRMHELRNESGKTGRYIELAQKFIMSTLRVDSFLHTQTRVAFLPNDLQDNVIHDFGRDIDNCVDYVTSYNQKKESINDLFL